MSTISTDMFQRRRLVLYLYLRCLMALVGVFKCGAHSLPLCVTLAEAPAQPMLSCIPCDWLMGMLKEWTVLLESQNLRTYESV